MVLNKENKITQRIDIRAVYLHANTFTGNPKATNEGTIEELGSKHIHIVIEQRALHLHDYRIGTE